MSEIQSSQPPPPDPTLPAFVPEDAAATLQESDASLTTATTTTANPSVASTNGSPVHSERSLFPLHTAPLSIEKRQTLSPVSPHPLHIAEPSDIPVLENQMDPQFNSAEAHPYLAMSNGADTAVNANSPDQSHFSSHQPLQHPSTMAADAASNLLDALTKNSLLLSTPQSQPQASLDLFGNGNVSADHADTDTLSSSSSVAKPAPPTLPSLPSGVDLGALLTKLAPTTPTVAPQPHQQPETNPSTPQTPAPLNGSSFSLPAAILPAAASVQAQLSPTSAKNPPTSSPNSKPSSLPQPTNHPLPPVPVVSSSLPGHPASGYPASLPPPPTFAQHKGQQSPTSGDGEENEEDNRPFTVDEEEEFSRFLADERDYVTQGQWDRFPNGSRLFIGNLPTEKVTKRDLFRIFHKHGRLAQVSIKQAYGFVQFLDQSSCASALRHEQGSSVRGRKMHLEISKPQRNTRNAASSDTARRRSRSPDYARGGSPRRGAANARGGREPQVDRYRSGATGRDTRDRDRDYASRRSPPPRYRERDDYRPGRRSRSRSPPLGRYRGRSPTPDVDDVPLPRRNPSQVPEVQILVSDELDRNFIWWVENHFRTRGLTADMLFLNPRLKLTAVVKRQVIEGVMAVVFLNLQMQATNKITIQIFDRRGEGEATYDQYENLDPPIAAELVVRSKQSHHLHAQQQPPVAAYGGYGAPPPQPQVQPQPQQQQALQQLGGIPNIAALLGSVDPATLQKLVAGLQQQQQQPQQQQYGGADLASILAGAAARPQVPQQSPPQQQPQQQQYGANNLAALLGQAQQRVAAQQQQQQQQQAPPLQQPPSAGQIGNIMETLAKWKQA